MYISDLETGDVLEGYYLLQSVASKQASNGKPFLSVVLADCSGTVDAKVWDYGGPITAADTGSVAYLKGSVSEYRGVRQVSVDRIRLADPSDRYAVSDLVPTAPIHVPDSLQKVRDFVDSIADPDYAAVCRAMLEEYGERFRSLPAAKSVHHSFLNGLLMHTLFMLQAADFLAAQYAEVIDRSLLLAGTLLHDFAKCEEFTTSQLGLVTDYSLRGQLLGHPVLGAQAVARCAEKLGTPEEKAALLEHMILSHHGEPDYGAAVRPCCAESELLSYIDMIDSRMEIYRETLEQTPAGEFSPRVFALDRRIYHHN